MRSWPRRRKAKSAETGKGEVVETEKGEVAEAKALGPGIKSAETFPEGGVHLVILLSSAR